MTTAADAPFVSDGSYIQFGIHGVPYSAIRIPLGVDYDLWMADVERFVAAYTRRFGGHIERAAVQQGAQYVPPSPPPPPPPPPPMENHGTTGTSASYRPSGGPSVVYVYDETGNQVPACSIHKTSSGTPRPMRNFGDRQKCTAKRRDGSYCDLAIAVG